MRFFSKTLNIDFVGKRKIAMFISIAVFIGSIVTLSVNWLNLGLDFKGGISITVGYPKEVNVETIRATLSKSGYKDVVVQHVGDTNAIVKISISAKENTSGVEDSNRVLDILRANSDDALDVRSREFIGPKVGEELRDDGGIAMLIAIGGILIYVMMRFEWRFAVGAITALVHDVFITLGFFSVFQWTFDLTVLAALLAVIGYSLNDTIVVYDRIRENFRKIRKGSTLNVTNRSLNETLSRTIVTSLTTLLVLSAMYFLGGEQIKPFAIALIIGVLVGTYSSIYVASSMVLALNIDRSHLMPVTKEEKQEDYP